MDEKTTYLLSAGEGVTFEHVKIGDGKLTRGNEVHYHIDVEWGPDRTCYLEIFFRNSVKISNDRYRRKSIVYIDSESYSELSKLFEEMPASVSFITDESENIKESRKNFSEGNILILSTTRSVRELVEDDVSNDLPTPPDDYMRRLGYHEK